MKYIFFFLALVTSSASLAKVANCKISAINGKAPSKESSFAIDTESVLVSIARGNGNETLINDESLFVLDTPAIWFDREEDCVYEKKTLPDRSIRHEFSCDGDIKFTVSLIINAQMGAGRYKSELEVPDFPIEENKISFSGCQ